MLDHWAKIGRNAEQWIYGEEAGIRVASYEAIEISLEFEEWELKWVLYNYRLWEYF